MTHDLETTPTGQPQPVLTSAIANPVPIGVAGFALTTFVLGLYTAGLLDAAGTTLVLALAVAYGGGIQIIAGLFALARGDQFPAAFMTTYGAFWIAYVIMSVYVLPKTGTEANQTVAAFLFPWLIITLIFTVAAWGSNWINVLTFVGLDVTFTLAFIGAAASTSGWTKAAGWAELVVGVLAWYIVLAELVNNLRGREVVPVFAMHPSPAVA